MLKKHARLIKLSGFLLALAPAMVTGISCGVFVGEPKIPEKLKNMK